MKSIESLIIWIPLLCLVLTSCVSGKLRKQDIVGVWREDDTRCEFEATSCAVFTFQEDGQFEARNIPSRYFGYSYSTHSKNALFNATGEWTLEITKDPLEYDEIRLHFDPVSKLGYPSYNSLLYVSGIRGRLNLSQWFGDESDSLYFVNSLTSENSR